jgi:hypothetical protein
VWALALGALLITVANRHAGPWAATACLAVYAIEPTLVGHGALVTSDVPAAFGFLAVLVTGWWWAWVPTWKRAAVFGTAAGVLFLSKHSAVLVLPVLAAVAVWVAWSRARGGWARGWRVLARRIPSGLLAALIAWAMLWAAFGFRAAPAPADNPAGTTLEWQRLGDGVPTRLARGLAAWRLVPEAYAFGAAYVAVHARARVAFFAGETGLGGWWEFFPTAAVVKTPPLLLVGALCGAAMALRSGFHGRGRLKPRAGVLLPLLLFGVLYGAVSLASNLNIGHRHLMPLYAAGVLFAGLFAAAQARRGRAACVAVVGLLAVQAVEVHRHHPHHLAYFSPIVGGPAQGWRWLVDSSLDWGQGLPAVRAWMERGGHGGQPVHVAYFGPVMPPLYGVEATLLPCVTPLDVGRPRYEPRAGWYVLGATTLQEIALPYAGGWDAGKEALFQEHRAFVQALPAERQPATHFPFLRRAALLGPVEQALVDEHEFLWFSRLCNYLRMRGPDATLGYAMLAFRLDDEEVRVLRTGRWDEAVQLAAARRTP